jgi:hypothetical protein
MTDASTDTLEEPGEAGLEGAPPLDVGPPLDAGPPDGAAG